MDKNITGEKVALSMLLELVQPCRKVRCTFLINNLKLTMNN